MLHSATTLTFAFAVCFGSSALAQEWSTHVTPAAATPAPLAAAPAQVTNPVLGLRGRWAGNGQVVLENGQVEAFKCVVTYLTDEAGTRVRHALRCKNEGKMIELKSNWTVEGTAINGTWKETKYEIDGTLTGSIAPEALNIYAEGTHASAAIEVKTSACAQDVRITFSREIRELTAGLKKC